MQFYHMYIFSLPYHDWLKRNPRVIQQTEYPSLVERTKKTWVLTARGKKICKVWVHLPKYKMGEKYYQVRVVGLERCATQNNIQGKFKFLCLWQTQSYLTWMHRLHAFKCNEKEIASKWLLVNHSREKLPIFTDPHIGKHWAMTWPTQGPSTF